MKIAIAILLALAYVLNSPILQIIYPNVSVDYDQYVAFSAARAKVYECMFFGFFWLIYLNSKLSTKAIASAMMVLTCGSMVDKVFFEITAYLYTDIILITLAVLIYLKVYAGEIRQRG